MTISVTHQFQSAVADGPDTGLVRPSDWNAGHVVTGVADADHTHPGGPGGEAFPVGSVFLSVVATNPRVLLGYGTWAAIAAGRCLVGFDGADPDFNAAEKTGGAKTHTLTVNEMPGHTHTLQRYPTATGSSSGFTADTSMSGTPANVTQPMGSAGGGAAHNNLQPYFTVYVWQRTA